MVIETKKRSLIKAISWRVLASITTMTIIYIFYHEVETAVLAGILESIIKILIYFFHERAWNSLNFGKKEITPFVLWITGLPLAGKSALGNMVFDEMKEFGLEVERLDGKDVRKLFPKAGFSREERIVHNERVAHLSSILEKNGISVVATFISPYREMRSFSREICKNYVEVYLKCDVETCKNRDTKGLYEKAVSGEIKNFTGVSDPYEEPDNPEITIDTRENSLEEAKEIIIKYIKRRFLK